MSEKQWIPFYLDLDPCESAIWMFELDKLLIKVWSRPESLWVLTKMAYMRRLHPKGVPFLGFKRMRQDEIWRDKHGWVVSGLKCVFFRQTPANQFSAVQ